MIGGVLKLAAWWVTSDWRWTLGTVLVLANWPYTVFFIVPTNRRIEATPPDQAGPEIRALIEHWGGLHAVRSALGVGAVAAFLWARHQPCGRN